MSRKYYAIWFTIFSLLQWTYASLGNYGSIDLILSMAIMAVMFSNVFGIAFVGYMFWGKGREFWLYFHNKTQWIDEFGSDFVREGASFGFSFWVHELIPLVFALIVLLHHYFCYKRCRDIGISAWWILVPLYNPIMLLLKKSKADSEEIVHN